MVIDKDPHLSIGPVKAQVIIESKEQHQFDSQSSVNEQTKFVKQSGSTCGVCLGRREIKDHKSHKTFRKLI